MGGRIVAGLKFLGYPCRIGYPIDMAIGIQDIHSIIFVVARLFVSKDDILIDMIFIGIALLIGGAVVTESVFAIPGLGRLTVDAILRRDYPVIQGVVLMFSLVYVLVNLLIDLTYTLVDPRIRY